jgi:hypothetical protein
MAIPDNPTNNTTDRHASTSTGDSCEKLDLAKCDEKALRFQPWRNWNARSTPPFTGRFGGLYLLACYSSSPPQRPPTVTNVPREVIYVGDAKNLAERPLSRAHNGVERYIELTGDRGLRCLYVAVAPLYTTGCPDYELWRIFALYLESMLIWRYTKRHGRPPLMRYKDGGEGGDWVKPEAKRLRAEVQSRPRSR